MSSIRLYVRNDYLYSREDRYIFSMDDITDTALVRTMMDAPGNYWFTPLNAPGGMETDQPLFSYLRPIFDPSAASSPLTILCVDLAQPELEQGKPAHLLFGELNCTNRKAKAWKRFSAEARHKETPGIGDSRILLFTLQGWDG